MYWIYDHPIWIIGILFVSTFVTVTWIGIFLTRATVHSWLHRERRANEMVSLALSSYFVLYGILLGLLAVATYQNYSTVGDIVDKEASSLSALYRDLSAYPQPIRSHLSIARVYETVMKPDESAVDNVNSKAEEAARAGQPKAP